MTREEQAKYISEKLMENPEFRKTFVGAITDAINVVVKAINALGQKPCDDAISRDEVIKLIDEKEDVNGKVDAESVRTDIVLMPSVTPQYTEAEIQNMQDLESVEIQTAYELGKAEGVEVLEEIRAEIIDTLYVDSLIFGELMEFKEEKIGADDVIEEFNRVTRAEVLQIIDKYKASPTGEEVEE